MEGEAWFTLSAKNCTVTCLQKPSWSHVSWNVMYMYSANVQTDSLLMFAAVKLRLVKASARFHRWMISIRTEREKEASVGSSSR